MLEEIEELTNPKVKAGKKALSAEQAQLKADGARRCSTRCATSRARTRAVRLVFEPKTSRIEQQELITTLLAHTSLESSAPINLTMVGVDGRPTQKSLRQMLVEWIAFRQRTVRAALAPSARQGAGRASTSSKAGSWCCSTSTR